MEKDKLEFHTTVYGMMNSRTYFKNRSRGGELMINFIISIVIALSVILLIGLAMGIAVFNRESIEKGGRKS